MEEFEGCYKNEKILSNNKKYFVNEFKSFEVDHIIDTRVGKDCKRHYLVYVKSWLTEEQLHGYESIIEEYWKKFEKEHINKQCYEESHSDKENKYLPNDELTFKKNSPYESPIYEEDHSSPRYDKSPPTFLSNLKTTQNDTLNGYQSSSLDDNSNDSESRFKGNNSNEANQCFDDEEEEESFDDESKSYEFDSPSLGIQQSFNDSKSTEARPTLHISKDMKKNFNGENKQYDHDDEQGVENLHIDEDFKNDKFDKGDDSNHMNDNQVDGEKDKVLDNRNLNENRYDNIQCEDKLELPETSESNESCNVSVETVETKTNDGVSDDKVIRSTSSFSDQASLSDRPSSSASDRLVKKRKLKTLDDIVRKISGGTNDQPIEKKIFNDSLLTNRLQTLDETLRDDCTLIQNEIKEEVKDRQNTTSPKDTQNLRPQFMHGGSHEKTNGNIYWSGGKFLQKSMARPFKCFTCEQKFEYEGDYHLHQQIMHGASRDGNNLQSPNVNDDVIRSYACRHCDAVFGSIQQLDEHRFEAHKARRRYGQCRYCPTKYADPLLLRRHEESHFRVQKPFQQESNGDHHGRESRSFPQYQRTVDHSNGNNNKGQMIDPIDVLRSTPEMDADRQNGSNEQQEGKSIIRNPIRNLLGKMINNPDTEPPTHNQSKHEASSPRQGSIALQYAQFVEETHGFPPDQLSPQIEQRSPIAPEDNGVPYDKELLHECPICKKLFNKKEVFDHHWITTHNDRIIFNCQTCKETFHNKAVYEPHLLTHTKQGYLCGYCRKVFYSGFTYDMHMKSHAQERPYQCHICGRSFSLRTNLRRHLAMHTEILPYRCSMCSKGFKRIDDLNTHIHEFHRQVAIITNNKQYQDRNNRYQDQQSGKDEIFTDDINTSHTNGDRPPSPVYNKHETHEQSFTKPPEGKNRKRAEPFRNQDHYIDETKMCFDSINQAHPMMHPLQKMHRLPVDPNLLRHRQISREVPVNRELMKMIPIPPPHNYSPVGKPSPMHPMMAHQLPAKMKCHDCDEEFTSQSLFEIHMQSHIKEVFSCIKCSKKFTKRSAFETHVASHDNNKSHNCPYCHRSFSMKGNLRRHIRIHTNEAPYECPICFQRFRRSDGLKGHIKRHETMGESAPTDMVPSQASAQTAN